MTVLLTLDTEQAAIMAHAADVAIAILGCRLERVDPEQVISNSCKLQARKVEQVKRQMAQGALPLYRQMNPKSQAQIIDQARSLSAAKTDDERQAALQQLFASICAARTLQPRPKQNREKDAFPHPWPEIPDEGGEP